MTHILVLTLAVLIGAVAGLRTLTAPAVVAWAAVLHWLNLSGTWADWLALPATVAVLTVAALVELVVDLLPAAPSRTDAALFAGRIVAGAFAGAVIGTAWGYPWGALGAGVFGAVLGTVGGLAARTRLAARRGRDLPVALLEDTVAIAGGLGVAALTALL